jgi:hypothetical protein
LRLLRKISSLGPGKDLVNPSATRSEEDMNQTSSCLRATRSRTK